MIKGLGANKRPFLYLDDYCPDVDIDKLHSDISYGLAQSEWVKRYVSAGVHPDYHDQELSTYVIENRFSKYDLELLNRFDRLETEKRIKFTSLVTQGLHPFWSCFLRVNRLIDRTGISNKSVGSDCEWTSNSKYFPELLHLIEQMPFQEVGRVMCFITEPNNVTVPHFDNMLTVEERPNDDFIYFSTLKSDNKKIYVMDGETMKKYYSDTSKNFIWFNEMDYHGTDATNRLTFSVRIEGKFLPEIREKLLSS